jgi:hypothetical protein
MRFEIAVVAGVGCWLFAVGCGDSSRGDDGSNGSDDSGPDWSSIDPPDNIDITSCVAITDDPDASLEEEREKLDQCASCCTAAGFSAASFLNDDHCTCGTNPEDSRDTVCAAEADETTSDSCQSCCDAAEFTGSGWIGGANPQCVCSGRADTLVCADTLDGAVPDETCFYCCLENGFISAAYTDFGGRECDCIGL